MSSSANFTDHINHICLKTKQITGWVLRTFTGRDQITMKTLWNCLIQPHLDYCSQLWAPYKSSDQQKPEAIQKSYTRQIDGMKFLNYWERLAALHMYSQERRQERYRIIYTWKAIENKVNNFGVTTYNSPRLGRLCKLPKITTTAPMSITTLKEASLKIRGPKLFNSAPKTIREMSECSTDSFKKQLDKYLASIPDQPRCPGYTSFCIADSNSILDTTLLTAEYARTN